MALYSQYSPWTDAAAYGQGLGNSLSQGLLQLPQERFALAQQQAQMVLRSQIANQTLQQRGQYNEGRLENQRQGLDQRAQNADMMQKLQELGMQLKMQQAQQPRVEGGYLIPGLGQGNTNAMGGQPPNQPQGTQPQATMGQQSSLPYGIQQLPRQAMAQPQVNPNEELASRLKALALYGQFSSTPGLQTNNAAQWGQQQASNAVVNPYPAQQGQMPQGLGTNVQPQANMQQPMQQGLGQQSQGGQMDTNAILQQAQQAIQQGADPMKVKQRLQSMGLSQ